MTTFDYSRSVATANKLLTRFGRNITHKAIGESVYDPETSSSTPAEVNTTVKACDFDFKDKSGGQIYQSDSLVQIGDRYALVAPSVTDISTADKLIIDGVTWNIINVKRLSPAGVNILFTVHIRK
jgi:hypothetical protein